MIDAVMYALLLILPVSALVARRLPVGSTVRMALIWAAIFALATLLVAGWQRYRTGSGQSGDTPYRTDLTSLIDHQKLT